MNMTKILHGALALSLVATSLKVVADTSASSIYDPSANFLTRKANFASADLAAQANRLYYKKVLVDSGYVVPANINDQASIDAAIAPFTLAQWKQKNGFSAAGAVTAGAKYYNGVDLGFGRNMNCVNQDGNAVANRIKGMACYVSSHGKIGSTMRDGLAAVNAVGNQSFAAVAMEYRPDAPENKVRFFVFGEGGDNGTILYPPLNTTANAFYQFDTGRGLRTQGQTVPGQPVPGVCLACHGGNLNAATGVITNSHFLPFDTFSLDFASQADRNAATVQFNKLNRWVYRAELLANPYTSPNPQNQIIDFLKGSYTPAPGTSPGSEIAATAVMHDNYVDARFAPAGSPPEIIKAYKSVVRPYCRGCHLAANLAITPAFLPAACNPENQMPHSETAFQNLYRHGEFVQPVINSIAAINSSPNCKSIFKLTDFEGLYPSRYGFFRYAFFGQNDMLAPGPTSAAGFSKIAKRTLRMTRSDSALPIHLDALEQNFNPMQVIQNASFEYIIPSTLDSIGGTPVITSTSVNPSVPGSTFKVATSVQGESPMYEEWLQTGRQLLAGDPLVEIDNVMSEWNLSVGTQIKQADFEDKTFGALGNPMLSISSVNTECFNKRTNDQISVNAFDISQRLKLSDDSGRYALSTNSTLCTNEIAKISFTLTNVPATKKVSWLSFNYETFGGTDGKGVAQLAYTTPTGTVTKNLHELTQEALDSNTGAAGGNVRIEVPVNTTFTISFKPSSGTALAPNKGLVVDNINVATYTSN